MADQGETGNEPDEVVEEPSKVVEPDVAESLEQVAKGERSKSRRQRLIQVGGIVVSTVLVIVVLFAVGIRSAPVVIGVVVAGIVGIVSVGGPPTRRQTTTQVTSTGEGATVHTETQLTNIAFSDKEPTWKGWSKDVGMLSVSPDRLVIVGRKRQLAIDAPFTAELLDHKFLFWMMVKVTGSIGSQQSPAIYLVVRGAPRSKIGPNTDEVTEESKWLVAEINNVSPP